MKVLCRFKETSNRVLSCTVSLLGFMVCLEIYCTGREITHLPHAKLQIENK